MTSTHPYLRRRVRPTRASPTAAPTVAAAPTPTSMRAPRVRPHSLQPFAAPDPRDVRVLGPDEPVVRVDRRRSAVGVLTVTNATSAAWESTDWVVGACTAQGQQAGRVADTSGNRPLVGYHDGHVLVALRHVRQLRRALFVPRDPAPVVVALQDGTALTLDAGDSETMHLLAVTVVDGMLELRAEPFPRASHDGDVLAAFGFTLSPPTIGRS